MAPLWQVLAGICLCVGVVLSPSPSDGAAAPSETALPPGIAVLLYHRFGDPRYPSTNVTVEALTGQMAYLRDKGYRVLDPRTFDRIMDGKQPSGPRDVLITVDDGYQSFLDNGFPVFERFGYPVLVFLSTESVERQYPDMLTWDEVESLRARGVSFGNHSHGHPHTGKRPRGETPDAYDQRLREDTLRARELLHNHGIDAPWYAYPYGEWTPRFGAVLSSLGFRRAFSQNPGVAQPGTGPDFRIPRMAVVGSAADLEEFAANLSRIPLDARLIEPVPGWLESPVSRIRVEIPGLGLWGTGEVNVFLSEMGRLDASLNGNLLAVTFSDPIPLKRSLNRLIVTARDRATGRYRMTSWLLLHP